jgi:hypothetical protein
MNTMSSPVSMIHYLLTSRQAHEPVDPAQGTADLRAPTLRVFLAWWGVTRHPQLATYDIVKRLWPVVHEPFSQEEIWGWCREALVECARYAGDAGVTLALL